jgi:hypothetical protein
MTQYKFNVGSQSVVRQPSWNPNGTLGGLSITDPFNSSNTQTCNYAHDDLHSPAWGSYTTTVGGAERVVEDLLNATGAYNALNEGLKEYGLVTAVQGVEKVASARCLGLKLSDPACTPQHNPRVPVGANLCLILQKKGELRGR